MPGIFVYYRAKKKADADGLLECTSTAMKSMGVENILERVCVLSVCELPVIVGYGTDGAAVNVSGQKWNARQVTSKPTLAVLGLLLRASA